MGGGVSRGPGYGTVKRERPVAAAKHTHTHMKKKKKKKKQGMQGWACELQQTKLLEGFTEVIFACASADVVNLHAEQRRYIRTTRHDCC